MVVQAGSIPKARCLQVSRFHRQRHRSSDVLELCLEARLERSRTGAAFIIDSLPVPVCQRARARRCRNVCDRAFCGLLCRQTGEVLRLAAPLIWTTQGQPVAVELLPGAYHDLTPISELTGDLSKDAALYSDKAYNDATGERFLLNDGGVRLVPIRKQNMKPHDRADEYALRLDRKRIETVNSHLESIGLEQLKACTHRGFDI
ncbi:transposase [Chloroflexus sp.]|uniref:transposase n=1 Tax=Chloroflexus sp. TaxID=1904827 RepID=UPI00404A6207